MSITVLPNETLTAILDELSPSSLAAVARVSTHFKAVAERILYSSIYISDLLTESAPLPWKTILWCKAMRQRDYLIENVRKVHIRWQADPGSPPPPAHYLLQTCEELAEILRALTPLESIDLFLGPANVVLHGYRLDSPEFQQEEPMHAIERVIRGCEFSHLRSCTLGADSSTKGIQPYTTVLVSFLTSLPRLRHLRLSDSGQYMNMHSALERLPADALPLLTTFRGSPDAAAALLPGRPVHYLSLTGQDSDVNRHNLPRMTCTTVPLRYLDLSAMSARPMLLRNVSTYLPTVESLRVKLALRHTLHYSFSGIRILAGLSSVLNAFTHLSFLDLSPTGSIGSDGVGRANPSEEFGLCVEWYRACPTLRRIVFPSQTEWALGVDGMGINYEGVVWTSRAPTPPPIPAGAAANANTMMEY